MLGEREEVWQLEWATDKERNTNTPSVLRYVPAWIGISCFHLFGSVSMAIMCDARGAWHFFWKVLVRACKRAITAIRTYGTRTYAVCYTGRYNTDYYVWLVRLFYTLLLVVVTTLSMIREYDDYACLLYMCLVFFFITLIKVGCFVLMVSWMVYSWPFLFMLDRFISLWLFLFAFVLLVPC